MSPADEGHNKRQRISQACVSCRKRKSKCDGAHPICSICKSYDRTCVYDSSGRKRGLQVGYVRSVETLLGIVIREVPTAEDTLRSLLRVPRVGGAFFDTAFIDSVTESWHSSQLHEDIKFLLRHQDEETQAIFEELPQLPDKSTQQIDNAESDVRHVLDEPSSEVAQVLTLPKLAQEGLPGNDIDETVFTLPDNAAELVDEYFTHIHPWFPIVERRDILYILHSVGSHKGLDVRDESRRACLLSIIALMFATHKPTVKNSDVQTARSASQIHQGIAHPDGPTAEQSARSLISAAIKNQEFDIGHIQASLLLVLIDLGIDQRETAWISLGTASRMLSTYSKGQHSPAGRLPHVFRGCRILDILVSVSLNRPISNSLCEGVDMVLDEDGLDEWEVWEVSQIAEPVAGKGRIPLRALSTFNLTYKLFQRLELAYCTTNIHMTYERLVQDIHTWEAELPAYCRVPGSAAPTPCSLVLQLHFNFVVAIILRITQRDSSKISIANDIGCTILSILNQHCQMVGHLSPYVRFIVEDCLRQLKAVGYAPSHEAVSDIVKHSQTTYKDSTAPLKLGKAQNHSSQTQDATRTRIIPNHTRFTECQQFNPGASNPSAQLIHNTTDQSGAMFDFGTLFANVIPGSWRDIDTSVLTETHVPDYAGFEESFNKHFNGMEDNEFDVLLEELPLPAEHSGSALDGEFAQNLGFLTTDMDPDFLTLFENNHPT